MSAGFLGETQELSDFQRLEELVLFLRGGLEKGCDRSLLVADLRLRRRRCTLISAIKIYLWMEYDASITATLLCHLEETFSFANMKGHY